MKMEPYIPISYLNDFIFCPRSIYFHQLYGAVSRRFYHTTSQVAGTNAHQTIDNKNYTTAKAVLQGADVYSEQYGLCGKIDIYDQGKKILTERKKKIRTIYDGYIFQLYAQAICLREMGYGVKRIRLYSMDDNKAYDIPLPEEDKEKFGQFQQLIEDMRSFQMNADFTPNANKCRACVYNALCDYSLADN